MDLFLGEESSAQGKQPACTEDPSSCSETSALRLATSFWNNSLEGTCRTKKGFFSSSQGNSRGVERYFPSRVRSRQVLDGRAALVLRDGLTTGGQQCVPGAFQPRRSAKAPAPHQARVLHPM